MAGETKYGAMFGMIPPAILPNGKESLGGMRALMHAVAAYGRGGGEGISKSVIGEFPIPPERQIIYGKIRDDESTGSGGVTFVAGDDAAFYDPDGYLAYAFDEINPYWPWKGEILENGITTTLPSQISGSGPVQGGANFAYPLNQDSIGAGALCALLRAGGHWIIIGVSEGGSGSGGSTSTITCSGGTQYPVTISGDTITVGDPI